MHTCIHTYININTHTSLFPHTPLIQQTTQASSVGFTSLWSLKTRSPAGPTMAQGQWDTKAEAPLAYCTHTKSSTPL